MLVSAALVWVLFVVVLILVLLGVIHAVPGVVVLNVAGLIGLAWVWMLLTMERLAAIELTPKTLRVGRSGSVPVEDLDPGWVRMLASNASDELKHRVESTPGPVALDTTTPKDAPTLGGVVGRMKGFSIVTLRLRDRTAVGVTTDDKHGLIAGLLTAIGS